MSSYPATYGYARFGYSSYGFTFTESVDKHIYGLRSTQGELNAQLRSHIVPSPELVSSSPQANIAYWNDGTSKTFVALRSYAP